MKKCMFCGEDINDAAIKCIHCDSFQNWRRFFGTSQVILSLLVALVSVSTVAVPIFVKALKSANSEISTTYLAGKVNRLYLLASNTGTRPGAISNVALVLEAKSYPITIGGGPVIVGPGDTVRLDLQTNGVTAAYHAALGVVSTAHGHPTRTSNCQVKVETVTFLGSKEVRKFVGRCVDLLPND